MSAVGMARIAVARRNDTPDVLPAGWAPAPPSAAAAARPSAFARAAGRPADSDTPCPPSNPVTDALGAVVTYFPTEINVTYVAVMAAIANGSRSSAGQFAATYLFLVATPIVVWLLYAGSVRARQLPMPWPPQSWPILEMGVATVAYAVWAYALPGSPFTSYRWYSPGLAGVLVIVFTAALGLGAAASGRQINVPGVARARRRGDGSGPALRLGSDPGRPPS